MAAPVPRIDLSNLVLGSELGGGGQGKVTEVNGLVIKGHWPTALKIYTPGARNPDTAVLERIVGFPRQLAPGDSSWLDEHTAWPAVIAEDGGVVRGFLMRTVPDAYYFGFHTRTRGTRQQLAYVAFLLNTDQYVSSSGLSVSDHDRLALLTSLAGALSRLHGLGVVVGDLSPKNLLFSFVSSPSCFLIDCDAMRVRGETVLEQIQTPDWEAPAGEPRATTATDAFKFGLLAIRLFARDQSSRDRTALAAVSPELGRLARLSQHRDPLQRPSPGTWMTALNAATLSAATTAPRATAPRPTAATPRISVPIPTVYPTTARPAMYPASGRPAAHPAAATVFPRPARRRPGGPVLLVALVVAIAAVIGVLVHSAMKSGASAGQPAGIGDSCLVGTWRDGKEHGSIKWDGHTVAMDGGGGEIDHISANGTDEQTWGTKSKPFYGEYKGHTLKEMLRGHNTLTIHATKSGHKISVTEDGFSAGSTNRYVYEGRTYSSYLSQHGTAYYNYECGVSKFKWRDKHRTVDSEARISKIP
jgi:hypothetical protein